MKSTAPSAPTFRAITYGKGWLIERHNGMFWMGMGAFEPMGESAAKQVLSDLKAQFKVLHAEDPK